MRYYKKIEETLLIFSMNFWFSKEGKNNWISNYKQIKKIKSCRDKKVKVQLKLVMMKVLNLDTKKQLTL